MSGGGFNSLVVDWLEFRFVLVLFFIHFGQIIHNIGFQRWQIIMNCQPQYFRKDLVIAMHQDMTHFLNLIPRRIGMLRLEIKAQHISGLTHNLHIFHDSLIQDLVVQQALIILVLKKFLNITYCQQNMLKPSPIINSFSHKSRFCLLQRSWRQREANCPLVQGQLPCP